MLFLLLYFILCSVTVAMWCVIVSINHYLSIYLSILVTAGLRVAMTKH